MEKILVTGGSGFLGSRICDYYKKTYMEQYEILAPTHKELDFVDNESVIRYCDYHLPDRIIHCAAQPDTTYAELHPKESYAINVTGTQHLAKMAGQLNIPFLYMSSDQVYSGRTIKGMEYQKETDAALEGKDDCPTNEYGKEKKEGEERSLFWNPKTRALRLSWMYDMGRPGLKTNGNLFTNLLEAKKKAESLPFEEAACFSLAFARNEYRGITNVWDVIKGLEQMTTLPPGVYNYGSENEYSTFVVAKKAAEILEVPVALVREDEKRYRDHPRNLTMSLEKLRSAGLDFPGTIRGLQEWSFL